MKLRNPDNEKYVKAGITAAAVVALAAILVLLILHADAVREDERRITGILTPFLYGAVIAYILAPLCNKFKRLFDKKFKDGRPKLSDALSIVAAILVAALLINLLLFLVIPQLWTSIKQLAQTMPDNINAAGEKIESLIADHPQLLETWNTYGTELQTKLETWMKTDLPVLAGRFIGNAALYVQKTAVLVKNVFLGMLISVYILINRKRFGAQAKMLLHGIFPNRAARVIEKEVRFADRMFNGFLVGKIVDSAIIGLLCFAGCLVLGLESPSLLAVIIGVTNIIPFFGPFIGAIPCALMLLIQNPVHALIFLIFVFVLQQLDGNVIGPRILGDSTGLSSFWVLFAILLFGGLWGVTGMIVGVPLFAVLYDIIRQLVSIGLGKHGRSGLESAYREEFHPETKPLPEEKG